MGKIEKLEKLQKLKESGAITEQEFNTEKEKLMSDKNTSNKKIKVMIAIIALILVIVGGIFAVYYFTNNNTQISTNENTVTEDGFDSLYETYDIDPDSENVQDFLDAIEEGLGITLEEV